MNKTEALAILDSIVKGLDDKKPVLPEQSSTQDGVTPEDASSDVSSEDTASEEKCAAAKCAKGKCTIEDYKKALSVVSGYLNDQIAKADAIVPMIAGGAGGMQDMLATATSNLQGAAGVPQEQMGGMQELQAQHSEMEAEPVVGPDDLLAYIYAAVVDEVKAEAFYEALSKVAPDEPSKTILDHIRSEEAEHVRELKQIVVTLQHMRSNSGDAQSKNLSLGRPLR